MKQPKRLIESTIDNKTYNVLLRRRGKTYLACSFCEPRQGCNATRKSSPYKSWKTYRKTQYAEHF